MRNKPFGQPSSILARAALGAMLLAGCTPPSGHRLSAPSPAVTAFPLAEARRASLSDTPFPEPVDSDMAQEWRRLSSQATLSEFGLFLGPLSPEETQLLAAIDRMPLPIVHRTSVETLRKVLSARALLSSSEAERLGQDVSGKTTPKMEAELYGAYNYVFASVGPPMEPPGTAMS